MGYARANYDVNGPECIVMRVHYWSFTKFHPFVTNFQLNAIVYRYLYMMRNDEVTQQEMFIMNTASTITTNE